MKSVRRLTEASLVTCLFVLLGGVADRACGQAATGVETTRYILLTGDGTPAGEQVVQRGSDGRTRVRYVFKDNGRGPELEEVIRVAPDGTLADYEVKGLAEMGGPVDERFSRSGDQVRWRSLAEAGAKEVTGAALYVPMNGSLEPVSISISAAAASPNGTLALLPSGTLTQRKVDEVEVVRDGARQTVQLLAQTGLWFTPAYHWATTGPSPRLFASIYPGWFQAIEDGWQGNLKLLADRQNAAQAVLLKEAAATLQQPLPGLTVIRNARVFDSVKARLGAASDVLVLRGRITAVLPAGSRVPGAAQEIDAAGRVMLPGLFDMHGHLDRWDGALNLAAGVTTVRDLGSNNAELQQIIDEAAAGSLLMPHIVLAGFLEGDSPFSSQAGIKIKTLNEAKAAIDWYAQRGFPQVKIYNSFPRQHLREAVAYAHRRGLRVSGHVPAFLRAHDVVAMGFDEIQHINQLMLTFLVTPKTDTRTLERFYLPAEKLARFDLKSRAARDFIALLKKHGTAIDPTLVVFDFMKQRDGEVSAPYAAVMAHLPPNVQRSFLSGGMKIPDDATAARYRASYDTMVEFVGLAYRAGVPLLAGTDGLAGFTLHSELALYVKAGLTPAQALQVATLNGARHTRTLHERGSIEAGKLADLVLVDGDPTRDIADLRKVALVITQGQLIRPAEVHRALGVRPFVQDAPALKEIVAR